MLPGRSLRGVVLLCAAIGIVACRTLPVDDATVVAAPSRGEPTAPTVIVQDMYRRPLSGAAVWFRPMHHEDYLALPDVITQADGVARPPDEYSPHDAGYDVVVSRRGYRSAVLRGFVGKATLQLPRSDPSTVRVRLATGSRCSSMPRAGNREPASHRRRDTWKQDYLASYARMTQSACAPSGPLSDWIATNTRPPPAAMDQPSSTKSLPPARSNRSSQSTSPVLAL